MASALVHQFIEIILAARAEAFEKRYQQQHIKGLAARAKELGYELMPTTT